MSNALKLLDNALERACLLLRDQPDPMIRAFQALDASFSIVPSDTSETDRKIMLAREGCEYLADVAGLARQHNCPDIAELSDSIVRELSPAVALCFPLSAVW